MALLPVKLMLCPPADKERVDNALNVAGSKMSDCCLKSHGSVAGGVTAMNCWGEGIGSVVLHG